MLLDSLAFFHGSRYRTWEITEDVVNAIKESEITRNTDTVYNDFTLSINPVTIENHRGVFSVNEFMSHIYVALQLLTNTTIMDSLYLYFTDDEIKSMDIKDYHIKLIKELYFDVDDFTIESADKRPFGNSYMQGDVLEHYFPDYNDEEYSAEEIKENELIADKIYEEVLDITTEIIRKFAMPFRLFVNARVDNSNDRVNPTQEQTKYYSVYRDNWLVSVSEFRDQKLEKLLNYERGTN